MFERSDEETAGGGNGTQIGPVHRSQGKNQGMYRMQVVLAAVFFIVDTLLHFAAPKITRARA